MTRQVEVNPGEFFAVSDRVILVKTYESVLGMMGKLGTVENDRLGYLLTFEGKLNNKPRTSSVTVALSIEGASQLLSDLLNGLELLVGQVQGEGDT